MEFHLVAKYLVVNGEKYSCAKDRCKESLKMSSNSHAVILARQQSALLRQLTGNFKLQRHVGKYRYVLRGEVRYGYLRAAILPCNILIYDGQESKTAKIQLVFRLLWSS